MRAFVNRSRARVSPRAGMIAFLALAAGCFAGTAAAGSCETPGVRLVAGDASDRAELCTALESGRATVGAWRLELPPGLVIRTVPRLPADTSEHAIARYDARTGEILLLGFEAAVAQSRAAPPAFGLAMTRSLWRSYLVHELAHAAAHDAFGRGFRRTAPGEYLACVAQVESMPAELREEILRNYADVSGFDRDAEITETYYLFDPARFTIKAYRHYAKPGNGAAFVRKILETGLPE